jgi:hypothetical protein
MRARSGCALLGAIVLALPLSGVSGPARVQAIHVSSSWTPPAFLPALLRRRVVAIPGTDLIETRHHVHEVSAAAVACTAASGDTPSASN